MPTGKANKQHCYKMAESISIKRLPSGNISVEYTGTNAECAALLAEAMHKHQDTHIIVCGALPTALDASGIDREHWYNNYLLKAKGLKF